MQLAGLRRDGTGEARARVANRGELPSLDISKRLVVPKAAPKSTLIFVRLQTKRINTQDVYKIAKLPM